MSAPHQFSRAQADRILRRAAEIEGSGDERPLTLEEVRGIGSEAGFAPHTVERAISEIQNASLLINRSPVRRTGLVVAHLSAVREIQVGLDADQLMRVVRLCQPYRDGAADVRLEEGEITWRDQKGLRLGVTSLGGITEVRAYVSGFLLRRGRWSGWVQSAADRLEALVSLVAAQRTGTFQQLPPSTPGHPPQAG